MQWDSHVFFGFFLNLWAYFSKSRFGFIQFSLPFYVGQFNLTALIKKGLRESYCELTRWARCPFSCAVFRVYCELTQSNQNLFRTPAVDLYQWPHIMFREEGETWQFGGIRLVFRVNLMAISSHKHAGLVVIARFAPKGRPLPSSDTTYSTRLTMLHEDGEPIKSKSSRSQTSSCPTFSDMIYIYWHESEV